MVKFKILFPAVTAIMLCQGNAAAMQEQQEPKKMHAKERNKENAQKMMLLEEHMKNQGAQQHDVKSRIGKMLHEVTKSKVFTCPTKEEAEAHGPKNNNEFTLNGIKYSGPSWNKEVTEYTHAYVDIDNQGNTKQIMCGDPSGYYLIVMFKEVNPTEGMAISAKDVTFDRTLAHPNNPGSNRYVMPLNTEFTINMH